MVCIGLSIAELPGCCEINPRLYSVKLRCNFSFFVVSQTKYIEYRYIRCGKSVCDVKKLMASSVMLLYHPFVSYLLSQRFSPWGPLFVK